MILVITLLVGLMVFLFAFGYYAKSQEEARAVAERVRQYGGGRRAAPARDFWENISRSKISAWAQAGARRFDFILWQREWFDLQVQRAGLPVTGGEFFIINAVVALIVGLFTFALSRDIVLALALAACWLLLAALYIRRKANKRMMAFDQQLGDALAMLSNAVKAGFSFPQAMEVVVQEFPDPISTEFARALKESQLGLPIETALEGIERRIVNDDFSLVATAVIVQRQVGGSLSQILDTIGNTVRDRLKFKGELRTLSAEGVMSAWVIGLLPIVLGALFFLGNPHYFDQMLETTLGRIAIFGGLLCELIGALLIRRLVKVKY